ncbi:hypothetical protein C5467_15015 [Photorhabdus khanii subsp. guanajuatensis]|uniref:Uncharacterized protein n=1 Tax=Photorhabdus khanii subsp. guanajuatensis TaxID=2100166 RepID=A0A4R4JJP4_9GAMM|nr:hypothetical protein C5467_15015 [Photorhabdus khanii subsp. guanajuatensis]
MYCIFLTIEPDYIKLNLILLGLWPKNADKKVYPGGQQNNLTIIVGWKINVYTTNSLTDQVLMNTGC